MIDYSELNKFYVGTQFPVIMNCGGMLLELGEDVKSLFYKINDDHYADVNRRGIVVQALRKRAIIRANYVIQEDSLIQIDSKQKLNKNANLVKKLTFNKSNYIR